MATARTVPGDEAIVYIDLLDSTPEPDGAMKRYMLRVDPWFKDYMASLGFKWVPTMRVGQGCTVHLNADELPSGRLVVAISNHYTAVIDGVIHDTFNPSADRGTTIYPPGYPRDQIPRAARWLENGNGWAYAPERCVYGYWKAA